MSDTLRDKSFRLTWRDGAYYVSEPDIETQEVVSLADALDALAASDAAWRAAVERMRAIGPWRDSPREYVGSAEDACEFAYGAAIDDILDEMGSK